MRLLVLAAALAAPALARPASPPAVVATAEALAAEVGAPPDGRRALRLAVDARAPALARLAETALAAALSARGYAVAPHRGAGDPEAAARAARDDWLLRVRAGLVPGARELALVGELIPAWPSFFLQRRPEARALPPRVVRALAAADAETLVLAREGRPAGAPFAVVRPLATLEGRVLALAVGDGGGGRTVVAAATPERLTVLGADGAPLAAREAAPAAAPVRDPAAAVAVGDFGGGRIALRRAGEAAGEVLALGPGGLEPAGALDAAPLCAGEAGALFGAFAPGTGVFEDRLARRIDPALPPRSERRLYGAAAAPRGGPVAFAALGTDLRLELLGEDLAPVRVPAPEALATGSGFALADLDGDGAAELVASSAAPDAPERVRVLAPLARAPLLHESPPLAGAVLAGAGGDVTGDGLDDALLAAVAPGPDGRPRTTLLLVTADAREAP